AAKAPPSEVDELYRWRDSAIKQLEQVVEFIDRAAKGRRSTIAQKAIVILQERGVDATLEFLASTLEQEEKDYKRRGHELAEASLFRGSLEALSLDYVSAKESFEKALRFDSGWWAPYNQIGILEQNLSHWNAAQEQYAIAEKLAKSEQDLAAIYSNR